MLKGHKSQFEVAPNGHIWDIEQENNDSNGVYSI